MTFPFSTLPGLALYAGSAHSNPVALGYKRNGRWRDISSSDFLDTVRRTGENLIRLGLKPGDRVGIAAASSPFWLMADLAALGAGAITVPLFPNAAQTVLRHQILDSGMRFLFVGNRALRDALLPLCGSIEHVLVLAPRASPSPSRSLASSITVPAGEWDRRAAAVQPGDTATLIYTSGSTGDPKGVELTHANIVSQIQAAPLRFPLDPAHDSALSFLPLAHIFERMVSCFYLASGVSLRFAEDPLQVAGDLREVHPTLLTVVPRFLEKARDRIVANAREARGPVTKLVAPLVELALRRACEKMEDSPQGWRDRLYDSLVYRRIRAKLGGRLRLVICGSAPLDPALCQFFLNTGTQVYEGYGLTESSPVLAANHPGHRKIGTVGRAFPGVELRIGDDGEVLARGPGVMRGYYGHPDATREAVDPEGWLHTGDLGNLDAEGYLTITGRKKELFKTSGGKYVAPIPLERALAAHAFVDAAVVIADGRPFVTALIFPAFEALSAGKDGTGVGIGDPGQAFLQSQNVQEQFAAIVHAVNDTVHPWERIRGFCLADSPPSIEGGELTPTLKLRRHAVEAKYAARIQSLYGGAGKP